MNEQTHTHIVSSIYCAQTASVHYNGNITTVTEELILCYFAEFSKQPGSAGVCISDMTPATCPQYVSTYNLRCIVNRKLHFLTGMLSF